MTGVAALALSAAFTSCSKNEELYDQGAVDQISASKIVENYNKAFIATFGQPAANQDWGFGSVAKTRAWNVNGNQWHDGVHYNYEYDAKVTKDEMNKVFDYVNDVNNVETVNQIPYTEYWVSQIWNGEDDANAQGVKAPNSVSYRNQNGATTEIVGGAQMDKLEIKETADGGWIHCNNFNSADNNDWKEGGEGGRTLMTSSGTYSFRYTNSQSSYLSEKYIIVPGEKIHSSLAGFYYVCFDFEKGYTDAEKAQETTYFSYKAKDNNGAEQAEQIISLPGYYTSTNMPTDQQILDAINNPNYKSISSISIKGYLYGDKHCDGDDNYTDWIVRISPAKERESSELVVRIIAEDLNAQAANSAAAPDGLEESDWDFNDVVFDVRYTSETTAMVKIVGAGGILPLYVAGNEVHQLLGQAGPDEEGHYKIQNSGTSQEFEVTGIQKSNRGSDIPVFVKRPSTSGGDVTLELKAPVGQPAAKICVKPTFKPCAERQDIRVKYPLFSKWVQDANLIWYYDE